MCSSAHGGRVGWPRLAKAIAFASFCLVPLPGRVPKAPGQRLLCHRQALLARRVGRWPLLVSGCTVSDCPFAPGRAVCSPLWDSRPMIPRQRLEDLTNPLFAPQRIG